MKGRKKGLAAVSMIALFFVFTLGCKSHKNQEAAAVGTPEKVVNKSADTKSTSTANDSLKAKIQKEQREAQQKIEKELAKEAVAALEDTRNAINAIDTGQTDDAVADLERAVGKLEVLLDREPTLALIPIEASTEMVDAITDLSSATASRKQAKKYFDDGDLPKARRLLDDLASEIRINIVNLPLESYPDALKEAAKLLDEGKADDARLMLQDALSTLVVTERIIPIPLIQAQALLELSAKKAEKDKEEAKNLLADANYQFKLARELGYVRSNKFEKKIKQLREKLDKEEKADNLFDSLLQDIRDLKKQMTG